MREIKIRAKRRHWKEHEGWDNWVYSNGYYYDKTNYWFLLPKEYSALAYAEHIIIDIETLGEYPGLKDKNGVEIYEGDCLGGMWDHTYIAYCDKCKSFEVIIIGRDKPDECLCCSGDVMWQELVEEDGKIEVIGNIYENKELLK